MMGRKRGDSDQHETGRIPRLESLREKAIA
jgi:hypothetical protein